MKSPRILAATVAALFATVSAQAANLIWDTVGLDGTTITPGSGNWDLDAGNLVWNNAGANVPWSQTSATVATNAAFFAGADGNYTITLGAALATSGLTFSNSGYTLTGGATPRTLTMGGSTINVATGKTATIGANVTLARTGSYMVVGGGRLIVSGTMTASTGASEIKDGSTLEVTTGGSVTFNGSPVIGANGAATISQDGNLLISGGAVTTNGATTNFVIGNLRTGTTTSAVTINAGSLTVSSNSADGIRFGSNTPDGTGWTVNGTLNLDGGVVTAPQIRRFNPSAGGTLNAVVNFNGSTLIANKTNAAFINGAITTNVKAGGAKIDSSTFDIGIAQNLLDAGGGGGLEKLGAGTLTLTGANTYTGTTTISGGTLQIGAGGTIGTLGTGPIINQGALTINRSNAFNLTNGISGNGSVTLTGGGTYTFGGTNTYTGTTTIGSAARVDLLGTFTSSISVPTGTQIGGEGSTTGSLTFAGTHSLFFDPGTAAHLTANSINASAAAITLIPTSAAGGIGNVVLEAAGGITGTVGANFIFSGRGNAYFNGTNTQLLFDSTPGALKWVGGHVTNPTFWDVQTTTNWDNAGTPDTFFTGDSVVFDNTATSYDVVVQGASVMPSSVTFNNSTVDYTVTGGAISGVASVVKNGNGSVVIANDNTYTGGTTINAGTIQLGDGASGTGTLGTGPVTNNAAIVTNFGTAGTIASAMSGSGTLTQSGSGTASLTGTNTYTGTTLITAGILQIGAGGTTGTLGAAAVINNATLAFNRSDDITVTNAIVGTGGLTKLGNGALILGNSNIYSGVTTISGGAIRVTASSGVLGDTASGTVVTGTGAAVQLQGGVTVTGEALTLTGEGVNASTAPGSLRSLSGNNEWAGDITIAPLAITRVVADAGSLKISGNIALSSVAADQFVLQGNGFGEISGIISGASRITRSVSGTGIWTLSGANTYTGKTSISSSFVRASSLNSVVGGLPSSNLGAPTTVANGTIDLGGSGGVSPTTGGLIYTGAGETTDRVINLASTSGGGSILDHSGTGLLKFTSNTTSAGTTAKFFTLQGSTGGTGEFAGAIGDGGGIVGLTKAGTGTWTLNGANTYTGATTVSAGTLAVGLTGSIAASTSINVAGGATFDVSALPAGFTLGSGQTLAGGAGTSAGQVNGFLTANANSIVAPGLGAGNRGTLSIAGNFFFNADARLALDFAGTVAGTGYDQVTVSGGEILLAGEVTSLSTLTFTPNISDVFYIILNNGTTQTFGTLNGVPEGGSLSIGGQDFQISYTSDFGGDGFQIDGSGNDVALMAVPEPASAATLLTGLGLLLGLTRRRQNAAS